MPRTGRRARRAASLLLAPVLAAILTVAAAAALATPVVTGVGSGRASVEPGRPATATATTTATTTATARTDGAPTPAATATATVTARTDGAPTPTPAATATATATTTVGAAGTAPMREVLLGPSGWVQWRLEAGRVPERLAPGHSFRGEISWVQDGLVRRARFAVPGSVPEQAPLLVSLHGLETRLDSAERQQRWGALTYQQGVVLVEVAGHNGSWNAGGCCGASALSGVDDLAYLDRALQIVSSLHVIDRRRVYLAGFSNGAMMAYRYACGRPGRITGILAVAGTMTAPCIPKLPTAVLAVNGSLDATIPVAGRPGGGLLGVRLPPVARGPSLFADSGAPVRRIVLPGLAHAWPTAADGYDATGQGWAWLAAHPKPLR